MLAGLTSEELAAGLDAVAETVLEEAGVVHPPVDAFALAKALGVVVAMDDQQHGRARYVRLHRARTPRATILLHSDPRAERRHWAVAHEIGEHVAPRAFRYLGVDPGEIFAGAREEVANRLAGRLLVPREWFAADAAACAWDLLELKTQYATASHELLARRMLECGPPAIISIFDQGQVYFRRANVRGRVPPPSPAERECWQAVHRLGRPQQRSAGARTIQCWPVHEPEWKREILRTELDDPGIDQDF